jgi:hypothetical protein
MYLFWNKGGQQDGEKTQLKCAGCEDAVFNMKVIDVCLASAKGRKREEERT